MSVPVVANCIFSLQQRKEQGNCYTCLLGQLSVSCVSQGKRNITLVLINAFSFAAPLSLGSL